MGNSTSTGGRVPPSTLEGVGPDGGDAAMYPLS